MVIPSYCDVLQIIYIVYLFLCLRQSELIINAEDLQIIPLADGTAERDEHDNVVFVTAGKYW